MLSITAELQGPLLLSEAGLLERAIFTQELPVGLDIISSTSWSEAPLVIPVSSAYYLSTGVSPQ